MSSKSKKETLLPLLTREKSNNTQYNSEQRIAWVMVSHTATNSLSLPSENYPIELRRERNEKKSARNSQAALNEIR